MRKSFLPLPCLIVLIISVNAAWFSTAAGESVKGTSTFQLVKAIKTKPSKGITAKTLAPLLKSKSEPLWEKGLAAVTTESLEDEESVEVIAKFVDRELHARHFSPSLSRGISLLSEADQPVATEKLAKLINSDDFRIVMLVADAVSQAQVASALEPLTRLPERRDFSQHYGFRRCVVDAIARYRDKSAVDFLVQRLASFDGQLKYETAMHLQRTTGQEFGGLAPDWKVWWQTNREGFEFPTQVASYSRSMPLKAPPKIIPWPEARPNFYGMTIYAKRVVFIIDRSGSMSSDVNGETRLMRAQQELQKAVSALTETDFFNIVAFDDRMEVFQSKLVQASEANKLDGIRFGYGLSPRGATACYEPLKMGLAASNDLELILFLSDGEPTSGALVDPSAIVAAVTNHNLIQRSTINTLGIDARGKHEDFLKNLAENNLGKLLLIR